MIVAACQMGVAAAGGGEAQMEAAGCFGAAVGTAFQIRDDILDVTSTNEVLGKPVGSDAEEHKNTYMALYGEEKCCAMSARAFVLSPDRVVSARSDRLHGRRAFLSVDGNEPIELVNEDIVRVRQSRHEVIMADTGLKSFYDIAFEKLIERER